MAYVHPGLQRVGPSNSDFPTIWTYTTADATAVVDTAGYFNDAADDLTVGDFIFANTSTGGSIAFGIYVVLSNASGVVDVSNVTALGGTDSD
jgi:hypothetical protein